MKRLTTTDGIGNAELVACFECHEPGEDNRNCGMCPKFEEMMGRLAVYERVGLEPEDIERMRDFEQTQSAKLLARVTELEAALAAAPCWCEDCEFYRYIEADGGSMCCNTESEWLADYPPNDTSCRHCKRRGEADV